MCSFNLYGKSKRSWSQNKSNRCYSLIHYDVVSRGAEETSVFLYLFKSNAIALDSFIRNTDRLNSNKNNITKWNDHYCFFKTSLSSEHIQKLTYNFFDSDLAQHRNGHQKGKPIYMQREKIYFTAAQTILIVPLALLN